MISRKPHPDASYFSSDYRGRIWWIDSIFKNIGLLQDDGSLSYGTSTMEFHEQSYTGYDEGSTVAMNIVAMTMWLMCNAELDESWYAKVSTNFEDAGTPLITNTVWDAPLDALSQWEVEVMRAYGEDLSDAVTDFDRNTSLLGIDRNGRLLLCYQLFVRIAQKVCSTMTFFYRTGTNTAHAGPILQFNYRINTRAIRSLTTAVSAMQDTPTERANRLANTKYDKIDGEGDGWMIGGRGYRGTIEGLLEMFDNQIMNQHEYDALAFNSFYFVNEVIILLTKQIESIIATFSDNDAGGKGNVRQALESIRAVRFRRPKHSCASINFKGASNSFKGITRKTFDNEQALPLSSSRKGDATIFNKKSSNIYECTHDG